MERFPDKIAVFAAHPDDDVIGCGGYLGRAAQYGSAILAVYLTDGSKSHPGSRRFPPATIAALREAEARASLKVLKINQRPLFVGLPDGGLARLKPAVRAKTIERLTAAVDAFAPELVLAPWKRDSHPDHGAAAALTAEVVARLRVTPAFEGYEVWLPIRGSRAEFPQPGETTTRTFKLNPEGIERKRRAIKAHESQTTRLIDDDPQGFYIDENLLQRWIEREERFHVMEPHSLVN